MNVYLDGKGVAQLRSKRYVQLLVPRGKHRIDLAHVHDLLYKSTHTVELTTSEIYIEVYPTLNSSGIHSLSHLPENFATDFEPAE